MRGPGEPTGEEWAEEMEERARDRALGAEAQLRAAGLFADEVERVAVEPVDDGTEHVIAEQDGEDAIPRVLPGSGRSTHGRLTNQANPVEGDDDESEDTDYTAQDGGWGPVGFIEWWKRNMTRRR